MPAISVLLPTRNAEAFVELAIVSILSQLQADFELLVLDDGSTDGTRRYLESLDDSRVRTIYTSPVGLPRLLNRGLEEARSQFIARMDADDVALPERLGLQADALSRDPRIAAIGCQVELIDDSGQRTGLWKLPLDDFTIKLMLLKDQTALVHPGVMFRREAVLGVGGYSEQYPVAQDRDLWLRLMSRHLFANSAHLLLQYRRHKTSVTETRKPEQVGAAEAMTVSFLKRHGVVLSPDEFRHFKELDVKVSSGLLGSTPVSDLVSYLTTLNGMLAFLERVCHVDQSHLRQHRSLIWETTARHAWGRDVRELWRLWPALHAIAPLEHRPGRLFRRSTGVAARRLMGRRN